VATRRLTVTLVSIKVTAVARKTLSGCTLGFAGATRAAFLLLWYAGLRASAPAFENMRELCRAVDVWHSIFALLSAGTPHHTDKPHCPLSLARGRGHKAAAHHANLCTLALI